jgi:hypothetical protein
MAMTLTMAVEMAMANLGTAVVGRHVTDRCRMRDV